MADDDRLKRLASYDLPADALPVELERVARLVADLFDAPTSGFAFDPADPLCAKIAAMEPGAVWTVEAGAGPGLPNFCAAALLSSCDGRSLGVFYVRDGRLRPPLTAA